MKLLQRVGKDEGVEEEDANGMVSDIEGVWSLGWERDIEIHKGCDLYLCGGGGGCGGGVGGGGSVDGSNGGDGDGGVDGSGGNSSVGNGGESGVYRSGRGGGSVVHGRYFGAGCGFCGGDGGRSGAGGGVCCETCCKVGSVVCEWEGMFFALL